MRRRDRSTIARAARTPLIGASLERRRALAWMLVPAAQLIVPVAWAMAGRIGSARLWPAQEYTRLILESQVPIEHQLVVLREPNRVILDLARVDPTPELFALTTHVQASDPHIAGIRIGTQTGGFLRVVLDLKEEVNAQVFALKPVAEFGYRLVVDLYPLTPLDPLMALLESERRREVARALVGEPRPPESKPPASDSRPPAPESRPPAPESR